MKLLLVIALSVAAVTAYPQKTPQRIVGGYITTISAYPFAVAMLFGAGANFRQRCGGIIVNNRSIVSAAHCFNVFQTANWRGRVGSTYASSGGVVHGIQRILNHPAYNRATLDSDISILRITNNFAFNNNVRAASIAGTTYNVPDNAPVWAIGWGVTAPHGVLSEQLRHVQIWIVNQAVCRSRYAELGHAITDNMLCSGWLDVGGRDQCQGDSGGPLLHNNVVVGVCSWGESCGLARFPGVNVRVSRFTPWIQSNA